MYTCTHQMWCHDAVVLPRFKSAGVWCCITGVLEEIAATIFKAYGQLFGGVQNFKYLSILINWKKFSRRVNMWRLWLFLPIFFAKSLVTIDLSSLFLYNIMHVISTVLLNKPNMSPKDICFVCHRRSLMRVRSVRRHSQHSQTSRHTRNDIQALMIFPVGHVERRSSQSRGLNGMNCSTLDIRRSLVSCVNCPSLPSLRLQDTCDITKVKNALHVHSVTNHSSKTSIL